MNTKAKLTFEIAPNPFLDGNQLKELLEANRSGMDFLSFALRDNPVDGNEIDGTILAITSRVQGIGSDLQEFFGNRPVVLNPNHPQFEAICRAVHAAAKAGESDSSACESKTRVAKAAPLLLVPRPPAQGSEHSAAPVA